MIHALRLQRELRSGSSLPLLVSGDDGASYVVKPYGSGDGALANAVDWLALRLGAALGLPTLAPALVQLPDEFAMQAADPEVRELIERSPGVNFATRWLASARSIDADDVNRLPRPLRDDVFLFDLLVLNVDRSAANPNALLDADGLHCLDYAASMALRACVLDADTVATAFLPQVRRNPFYRDGIDADNFIARVDALSPDRDVVGDLPLAWLEPGLPHLDASEQRAVVCARVQSLLDGAPGLRAHLAALPAIEPESDAARRARADASKREFARRHGGFHRA